MDDVFPSNPDLLSKRELSTLTPLQAKSEAWNGFLKIWLEKGMADWQVLLSQPEYQVFSSDLPVTDMLAAAELKKVVDSRIDGVEEYQDSKKFLDFWKVQSKIMKDLKGSVQSANGKIATTIKTF